TLCCICIAAISKPQTDPSRLNLSFNFMTLYAGTPETQVAYFINKYVGAFFATGYTWSPRHSIIQIGERADLVSLHGAYWKFGLVGRLPLRQSRTTPWLRVAYVGSQYDEELESKAYYAGSGTVITKTHLSGTTHGFAVAPGVDIRLGKKFDLRVGYQVGYYKRGDSFGSRDMDYQPGFGAVSVMLPEQVIAGFNYRIGSIKQKLPKE
ncbi:MAG: hypothetical protein KDC07_12385, partial [Chitinophagaceae bacterium]|nr:hypothetical protein [Chitinophagaceae bacterium]